MDETVKELSSIDGAFIIRGDGVLISAGSLIHTPEYTHNLPSGLGSRHAAAASISQAVEVVVALWRVGRLVPVQQQARLRLEQRYTAPSALRCCMGRSSTAFRV